MKAATEREVPVLAACVKLEEAPANSADPRPRQAEERMREAQEQKLQVMRRALAGGTAARCGLSLHFCAAALCGRQAFRSSDEAAKRCLCLAIQTTHVPQSM